MCEHGRALPTFCLGIVLAQQLPELPLPGFLGGFRAPTVGEEREEDRFLGRGKNFVKGSQ